MTEATDEFPSWRRRVHLQAVDKFYLSQFAEQLWDARQSLRSPLEVSVLQHQLNQLRVPSAHSLLQDWTHTHFTLQRQWARPVYTCETRSHGRENSLVQPCALQCVGSVVCLSSTLVDSRWPRHTASSSGVRPLGSRRSTSCCGAKTREQHRRNAVRRIKRM